MASIGENNATISTLTYSPIPEDHGKLISCQAFVEGLPGSELEDSRRLYVHCKFPKLLLFYTLQSILCLASQKEVLAI